MVKISKTKLSDALRSANLNLSDSQLEEVINHFSDDSKSWWVIMLKVIAYAIGLILGGFATTASACTVYGLF